MSDLRISPGPTCSITAATILPGPDLSVGLINKAYAIREAIEAGRRRFDFLKGAERYKYSLGGQDRAIYRIVVTR